MIKVIYSWQSDDKTEYSQIVKVSYKDNTGTKKVLYYNNNNTSIADLVPYSSLGETIYNLLIENPHAMDPDFPYVEYSYKYGTNKFIQIIRLEDEEQGTKEYLFQRPNSNEVSGYSEHTYAKLEKALEAMIDYKAHIMTQD